MANITIDGLVGKAAVATDQIEVQATAGYDGVFGVIQVLPGAPPTPAARDAEPGTQMGLFG